MLHKVRIQIITTGGKHWIGGSQYTRNLVRALSFLPKEERPETLIKMEESHFDPELLDEFTRRLGFRVECPDGRMVPGGRSSSVRAWFHRLFSLNSPEEPELPQVSFPLKDGRLISSGIGIMWIPDFQYKRLAYLFSPDEIARRDAVFTKMLSQKFILVLSSEAVRKDLFAFFPWFSQANVRILRFHSVILDEEWERDPSELTERFSLPERFAYNPSQLWQHKGHKTLFEALAFLRRDRKIRIPVVMTGSKIDWRNSEFGNELWRLAETLGIEDQLLHLGLISRADQIQIFRLCSFVIQPSEFEGWSTVVEDARAVGRPLIVSDIETHIEQDVSSASFFKVRDPHDLAEKLEYGWSKATAPAMFWSPEPSKSEARNRALKYAKNFLEIVGDALRQSGRVA